MRLVSLVGTERPVDLIATTMGPGSRIDVASSDFSIFAYESLREQLDRVESARFILPSSDQPVALLGSERDRRARNQLRTQAIARRVQDWIEKTVGVRQADGVVPQGMIGLRGEQGEPVLGLLGSLGFTTEGLGIVPGNPLNLIQGSEGPEDARLLAEWFDSQWSSLREPDGAKERLLAQLRFLSEDRSPGLIYALVLHHLFAARGDELDEEKIMKSATGIRDTKVWNKLYKFQKDGVVGAIDKLNRFGGCIIADSVGLGKTFEALAVIKYHELRNDRVLVLCPKRLRDNWTLYAANDRRNPLANDRFNYDVLNHTDLSRDTGLSGDIDLAHVNWGNYDLVVIDESHNFRNKRTPQAGSETRYDRLMRKVIREGVRTRVLMLSATPVNNRLADLRNQIVFATEGDDTALRSQGISSIDSTTRTAQKQFNRWLELDDEKRTSSRLIDMLGFDYFALLDALTIARSRKHIEKYYGLDETGKFPQRRKPMNIKSDIDVRNEFPSVSEINLEIRRLNLAAYAPLRYILPNRREAYDRLYSTRLSDGSGYFRQMDREESLTHLLRINLLKRLESSVASFALTIERQLREVETLVEQVDRGVTDVDPIDIEEIDIDDPTFETLLVGRKVKVLLQDVDVVRWRQDLIEDRDRLTQLVGTAQAVTEERDAKLAVLRAMIAEKAREPINDGNRKVIVFTAFADTARYLYENLSPWARESLGQHSALVTGIGGNRTTLDTLRLDLGSILSAFAPKAKERPEDFAEEGELDLLIATDCISEGQNLQDCDWLINYDIHWNPVRIIQRFGRIDRIGSPNRVIQLVNFWPNIELEEYINLEQRVSGRMVLLDISATGEENLIEQQSGDQMNDLEYRRRQMLKLQDTVIDMEDLSSGVSIVDLTLADFRIDLAEFRQQAPSLLDSQPLGAFAVTTSLDPEIPPGVIFCLRAVGPVATRIPVDRYPLAPEFLVHVGEDGTVVLPYPQVKQLLDRLKRISLGRDMPDSTAIARLSAMTASGDDMQSVTELLGAAMRSVIGKAEERAVNSLFTPGGTQVFPEDTIGVDDFEVLAYLVVLDAGEE